MVIQWLDSFLPGIFEIIAILKFKVRMQGSTQQFIKLISKVLLFRHCDNSLTSL